MEFSTVIVFEYHCPWNLFSFLEKNTLTLTGKMWFTQFIHKRKKKTKKTTLSLNATGILYNTFMPWIQAMKIHSQMSDCISPLISSKTIMGKE